MKRVSLVGTVHEEAGLASISGLLGILERITPEVIFLEIPSGAFDDYSKGSRRNLESTAVSRYHEMRHVDLVPVDLPTQTQSSSRITRIYTGASRARVLSTVG